MCWQNYRGSSEYIMLLPYKVKNALSFVLLCLTSGSARMCRCVDRRKTRARGMCDVKDTLYTIILQVYSQCFPNVFSALQFGLNFSKINISEVPNTNNECFISLKIIHNTKFFVSRLYIICI